MNGHNCTCEGGEHRESDEENASDSPRERSHTTQQIDRLIDGGAFVQQLDGCVRRDSHSRLFRRDSREKQKDYESNSCQQARASKEYARGDFGGRGGGSGNK